MRIKAERGQADRADRHEQCDTATPGITHRLLLQRTIGFPVQPARPEQGIARHQCHTGQQAEPADPIPGAACKTAPDHADAMQQCAQGHALHERGQC